MANEAYTASEKCGTNTYAIAHEEPIHHYHGFIDILQEANSNKAAPERENLAPRSCYQSSFSSQTARCVLSHKRFAVVSKQSVVIQSVRPWLGLPNLSLATLTMTRAEITRRRRCHPAVHPQHHSVSIFHLSGHP